MPISDESTSKTPAIGGRKALSKRTRFEIFKRDGFKCLYCGATPVQKVLRVDHVVPVVGGGPDEPSNLVTSCFDCNAGKGPVPLEARKLGSGFASEADREHAEQIREWLKVQRDVDNAKGEVINELLDLWQRELGEPAPDIHSRLRACLSRNSIAEIRDAIIATAAKRLYGSRQLKYFYGVLRGMRDEKPHDEKPVHKPELKPKWSQRAQRVSRHLVAWNKAAPESATLDDVFKEFALAAWGSPEAIGYAEYTTEWDGGTESRCRGLVLRTKAVANSESVTFWVEDDPEANVAAELLEEIANADSNAGFLWHVFFKPEGYAKPTTKEEINSAGRALTALIADAKEFVRYLRSGDEKELRECREHFGWPCPTWLSD